MGMQYERDGYAVLVKSAFVLFVPHGQAMGNERLGLFCVGYDLKDFVFLFPFMVWINILLVIPEESSFVL